MLYTYARDIIRSGLGRPVDYQMLIEDTKFAASELLVNDFSLAEVEKSSKNWAMNILLKNQPMKLHGILRRFWPHGDNPEFVGFDACTS